MQTSPNKCSWLASSLLPVTGLLELSPALSLGPALDLYWLSNLTIDSDSMPSLLMDFQGTLGKFTYIQATWKQGPLPQTLSLLKRDLPVFLQCWLPWKDVIEGVTETHM